MITIWNLRIQSKSLSYTKKIVITVSLSWNTCISWKNSDQHAFRAVNTLFTSRHPIKTRRQQTLGYVCWNPEMCLLTSRVENYLKACWTIFNTFLSTNPINKHGSVHLLMTRVDNLCWKSVLKFTKSVLKYSKSVLKKTKCVEIDKKFVENWKDCWQRNFSEIIWRWCW